MDAHTEDSKVDATNGQQGLFSELRKHNERRVRIAALLEARRARHLSVERVIQVQRKRRVSQGR